MRKTRNVAVSIREEHRLADLNRVGRVVSKVIGSHQQGFRSGLEGVFPSEDSSRTVADGPSDISLEFFAVVSLNVVGEEGEAAE